MGGESGDGGKRNRGSSIPGAGTVDQAFHLSGVGKLVAAIVKSG
jgi:hypothetical protein